MDISKQLIRLGERMRGPTSTEQEITPETILQLMKDVDEIRRTLKHVMVELEDIRERTR